ncbi:MULTISPECIES: rhomboid family intramembrane serine protease [Alphaproteobacteria]|uniref:Rhomboid family intramembrane serine protease n=2 Tax=Alphaproteobacteria TaxID=28211 RepID=A0A512HCQ6_9HYPH|nr:MULTISPECIES: rhomboid family intramembrane serine protease [Alphaproteobacteria]GEO83223.1 rhomboid family intramembrane serine protease [Ciceribacter naphthalenivorans]GLR20382.1 rhomboid family intramembrane serine protease [Ciceribacter naphthalenivorans]GLT03238.1 rhomboid family intramembrane serine protease [Sphingomonas psychrolutea]
MDELPPRSPYDKADGPGEEASAPAFNLPPVIVAALIGLGAVYAVQSLFLSASTAEWLAVTFGFSPLRYVYPLSEQGYEWLWTPVTYSFLHGSLEHLGFNGLWLAAFGTPVARRIGTARFVLFWIVSAAAGAALHAAVNWGQPSIMIGASGVVSALMGSACRFAFGSSGRAVSHHIGVQPPRLSIAEALGIRTVRVFILAWFFGNLAVAVGLPLFGDLAGAIAWDAHIGGFLFGFLLFGLFDPAPERDRSF